MKKAVFVLLIGYIVLNCAFISVFIYRSSTLLAPGDETDQGTIMIEILNQNPELYITNPEGKSYSFNYSEINIYLLDLNVSSNFGADNWWYVLEDLRHGVSYASVGFVANSTVGSVRWGNKLTVFGENLNSGTQKNASVIYYINVSNHAPLLGNISSEIFFCEGDRFENILFNATDIDEDELELSLEPQVPPFFAYSSDTVNSLSYSSLGVAGKMFASNLIYLGEPVGTVFSKRHVKTYQSKLYATDCPSCTPLGHVDSRDFNITLIEINNPPLVDVLGPNKTAETLWAYGSENRTLDRQVEIYDKECDCDQSSGDFSISLTFEDGVEPFFTLGDFGQINFIANESLLGENDSSVVYNLTLCVTDSALSNPHPNITDFCGQDGLNQTTCQTFSITITAENRPPRFLSYSPENLVLNAKAGEKIYFNVTDYDPDGTLPDTYWYVDGNLKEFDSQSSFDEFAYSFGCGISGVHYIKAEISDGELTDSVQWNVTVGFVACSSSPGSSGSGGGGGAGLYCDATWVCNSWQICKNTSLGLLNGDLAGENYRSIQKECGINNFNQEVCGYQRRACSDVNLCGRPYGKPTELQACYYTENPDCFDGIKNCHDGACEFLVDCGGPCGECATCSDRTQNQGEEGIDCGGPCPTQCPVELPAGPIFLTSLIVIVSVIAVIVGIILIIHLRGWLKKRNVLAG